MSVRFITLHCGAEGELDVPLFLFEPTVADVVSKAGFCDWQRIWRNMEEAARKHIEEAESKNRRG
jgi:hypothetical protein